MVVKIAMLTELEGQKINYKETGEAADTVVILQGWGTSLHVYDRIAAVLAQQYRVIQFDFPGFGESEEPKEAWSVDDFTDFFIRFMEKLEIKRAVLLGHSYGGRVILKLFGRDRLPFEIERVVLVGSAGIVHPKTPQQLRKIKRYKRIKKLVDNKLANALFPQLIENWKSRQGSEDYRRATPIMRQCMVKAVNEDLSPLLPRVNREVLLIWGENDTATPLEDGRRMEREMPNAGLALIQNAGHFCFLEQPVVFDNILKSYFKIK